MSDLQVGTASAIPLAYIRSIQDGYSENLKHFITFAGDIVNEETIRGYFYHLCESDYTANSIRIERAAVTSRIKRAMEDAPLEEQTRLDKLFKNLNRDIPAPKVNSVAITSDMPLSYGEVEKLIMSATIRLSMFLRFLIATGCRISETLDIKVGHCDRQGDWMKIRVTGKGNKERYVKIPATLYDLIRGFFRGEEFLFETDTGSHYSRVYVTSQIAKLGRKVLNRRISAHTFRHTFATQMLRRGVLVDGLSRYLGHSSVSITLDLYCHNEVSEAEILDHISELAMCAVPAGSAE